MGWDGMDSNWRCLVCDGHGNSGSLRQPVAVYGATATTLSLDEVMKLLKLR